MTHATAPAGVPDTRQLTVLDRIARNPVGVLVVVLAVLIVVTGIIEPAYLSFGGLRNTLLQAAPLGILGGAQTVLLLTGGIDLSIAMIATASAYVAGNQSPNGAAIAIILGIVVGLIAGAANGVGVAVFQVNPLIMTLAMSAIILGLFTSWTTGWLRGSTSVAPFIKTLGGRSFLGGRVPYNVLVWAGVAAVLLWLLRRSGFGRLLYAVGDNDIAVRLAGVRVWQVKVAAYALAGVLGSIGGILIAGRTGAVDLQLAGAFLLPSVAAAVIGGCSIFGGVGSYTGTILGALILSVVNSMLTYLNTGQAVQQIVYGSIVLGLAWGYSTLTKRA